jgi:hypothetical protein
MSHENRVSALQYWLLIDRTPQGPFDLAEVQAKLDAGHITLSTVASCDGRTWFPLASLPGFAATPRTPSAGSRPPTRANATNASPKTVIASPPQASPSPTTQPAATPPPRRPRSRGWLLLSGAGLVLVALVLLIVLWPAGKSAEGDDKQATPVTHKGQHEDTPSTPNRRNQTAKDYPLARTKWVGKEYIHKTADQLTFEFLDDKDVRKTSRERASWVRSTGDYVVRENEVTVTLRYKKTDPSGREIYERVEYVGQIKDGTIVGEARVERGARWRFEVTQVRTNPTPQTKR